MYYVEQSRKIKSNFAFIRFSTNFASQIMQYSEDPHLNATLKKMPYC